MSSLKLTDAEVYQQLLDDLLENLGPHGLKRFLIYAKAARGELAAACQPWVTYMEEETIQRGMQAMPPVQGGSPQDKAKVVYARGKKTAAVTSLAEVPSEPPKNLSAMTDDELHRFGLELMGKNLGLFGMMVFSRLCTPGTGDYTRDRHKWLSKLDRETVLAQIRQLQEASLDSRKA